MAQCWLYDQLANPVNLYTQDVLQALKGVNALPDFVQVGNEITSGAMIHIPSSSTDCWGNNAVVNLAFNCQASNANCMCGIAMIAD